MKRFLLFTGFNYYPSGGWDDFANSFDTAEEAKVVGEHFINNQCGDWAHIVDVVSCAKLVWSQTDKEWL